MLFFQKKIAEVIIPNTHWNDY